MCSPNLHKYNSQNLKDTILLSIENKYPKCIDMGAGDDLPMCDEVNKNPGIDCNPRRCADYT